MANFELSFEAKADLKEIHQYGVREWGEALADRYFTELFERLHEVGDDPYRFPTAHHVQVGYRRSVFRSHAIYFEITGGVVEIMTILRSQSPNRLGD